MYDVRSLHHQNTHGRKRHVPNPNNLNTPAAPAAPTIGNTRLSSNAIGNASQGNVF